MPKKSAIKRLDGYVQNRQRPDNEEAKNTIVDYIYQILMREGTTEKGITNLFELPLIAHVPLGAEDKLGNPDYPIACTFIYGDDDWVKNIDD